MLGFLYLCDLCLGGWAACAILLIILDYLDVSLNVVQDVITNPWDLGLEKHYFFLD